MKFFCMRAWSPAYGKRIMIRYRITVVQITRAFDADNWLHCLVILVAKQHRPRHMPCGAQTLLGHNRVLDLFHSGKKYGKRSAKRSRQIISSRNMRSPRLRWLSGLINRKSWDFVIVLVPISALFSELCILRIGVNSNCDLECFPLLWHDQIVLRVAESHRRFSIIGFTSGGYGWLLRLVYLIF